MINHVRTLLLNRRRADCDQDAVDYVHVPSDFARIDYPKHVEAARQVLVPGNMPESRLNARLDALVQCAYHPEIRAAADALDPRHSYDLRRDFWDRQAAAKCSIRTVTAASSAVFQLRTFPALQSLLSNSEYEWYGTWGPAGLHYARANRPLRRASLRFDSRSPGRSSLILLHLGLHLDITTGSQGPEFDGAGTFRVVASGAMRQELVDLLAAAEEAVDLVSPHPAELDEASRALRELAVSSHPPPVRVGAATLLVCTLMDQVRRNSGNG